MALLISLSCYVIYYVVLIVVPRGGRGRGHFCFLFFVVFYPREPMPREEIRINRGGSHNWLLAGRLAGCELAVAWLLAGYMNGN